ncbi:MAG: DUF2092 domain-containing protein [Cyclobacteriaceae bacterium]|nr:DUF2092 domain-containing protein [Cyclobacteriaceae bacterium]
MKNLIYLSAILITGWSCSNLAVEKTGIYDVRAVEVLDSLSNVIGSLTSVSYTLNTKVKEQNAAHDIIEFSNEHDVYMRGPNKLLVHTNGIRGEKNYWYNGKTFSYFSYSKNEYDTMAAPGTILETIDFLHKKYKVDFPASDFFYPTLTDDVLTNFDKLLYWGRNQIDGKKMDVISAYNKNETIQIWVDSKTKFPVKFIIFKEGDRYEASFSNWKRNPKLPDVLFEFKPPIEAQKITLESRKKS